MRISSGSFGLLYLNPPYDYSLAPDSKSERLEALFLKRFQETLQKDGWLVLIIPYTVLPHCASILARHFDRLQIFAFPEDDFRVFHQCLVLGRKRALVAKAQAAKAEQEMICIAGMDPEVFLKTAPQLASCSERLTIPAPRHPTCTFKCNRIDQRRSLHQESTTHRHSPV